MRTLHLSGKVYQSPCNRYTLILRKTSAPNSIIKATGTNEKSHTPILTYKKITVLPDSLLLMGFYIQNRYDGKRRFTTVAAELLKDPTVEFVVLVTARGGICDLVCFSL
jgi:hypothetical protein